MKNNSITLEEKRKILKAVIDAEKYTSVEFQVHIDTQCKDDVIEKATGIFQILHMNKTKTKNWVLFYLSLEDQKFAIIGDDFIKSTIPAHFWNDVKSHMRRRLNEGQLALSLSEGILMAGDKFKFYIPKQTNDFNELPDEIVLGKGVKEISHQ